MKYLLDVNTLVALGVQSHVSHSAANRWYVAQKKQGARFLTCSISELGFLRVTLQAKLLPDLASAQSYLKSLQTAMNAKLLADDVAGMDLPAYVQKPAELTDGHLLKLAEANGAKLATLDVGIVGAELIR